MTSGPGERETLRPAYLIFTVLISLSQAIFVVLASITVYRLFQRGIQNSSPRRSLLAFIITLFVSTTIMFGSTVAYYFRFMSSSSAESSSFDAIRTSSLIMAGCSRLNFLLSDLIVIWRAWILLNRPSSKVALSMAMFIAIGCTLASTTLWMLGAQITELNLFKQKCPLFFNALWMYGPHLAESNLFKQQGILIQFLMIVPLISTNIIATSVVGYKVWMYYTHIKIHLQNQSGRSRIHQILILLLESGLVYCAIWIVYLAFAIKDYASSPSSASNIAASDCVDCILPYIAAIYPVAVIFLVGNGVKQLDCTESAPGSIRFASVINLSSFIESVTEHAGSMETGP